MMWNFFQDFEKEIDILCSIFNDNLEWTEQLGRDQFSLLLAPEVLNWHLDGCRLVRSVLAWYRVIAQRRSTEQQLGAIQFKTCLYVPFNLFIVPGYHWTKCQII